MRAFRSVVAAAFGATMLTVAVAGCTPAQDSSHENGLSVVASTDVWGSVANAVTGDHAAVKSIMNSGTADPHSFEATPTDAAAIADAALVVYNGGGYDHWVDDVLASHPGVKTVNAYELAGDKPPANEHVFYDLDAAKAVATRVAGELGVLDTDHADAYRANAAEFGRRADAIQQQERAIAQVHPGAAVLATEPVAHYLLTTAGLTDKTPAGFASAAEEGDDPAPADVAAALDLVNTHQVAVLVFNPQTESAVTKQLRDAAQRAGVPVVSTTETLPTGVDYLTWQRNTVGDLSSQLDKTPATNR